MVKPSKMCKKRLHKEWKAIVKEPIDFVRAAPNPSNLLEWHFVIDSLDDARYRNGCYHGTLVFPADYPWKPPSLSLKTPTGRFQTNTRLCLSMTDFHPESWNPMWSVSSILAAVVSFFVEDTQTYGSIRTSQSRKKLLAKQSLAFNVKNKMFRELFPDLVARHEASLGKAGIQNGDNSRLPATGGLTKRKSNLKVGREASKGSTGGQDAGATSSPEFADKLAYGVLGVPLIALLIVLGYVVSRGL
jgi:ubiquitin-conjugating enzyme E2 J2